MARCESPLDAGSWMGCVSHCGVTAFPVEALAILIGCMSPHLLGLDMITIGRVQGTRGSRRRFNRGLMLLVQLGKCIQERAPGDSIEKMNFQPGKLF